MFDYSSHIIELSSCGFRSISGKGKVQPREHFAQLKRGKIKCFSYSSRRRLKEFLYNNISHGTCYGITCTVPFMQFDEDMWLLLLKRFFMRVTRLNQPLVYRVELQTNGMPHLHCVSYFQKISDCFNVQEAWWESLFSIEYEDEEYGKISLIQRDGALLYSCMLSAPTSNFTQWYRYLCSHATKQKQAQLGYKGKHWGICNRKMFFENQVKTQYKIDDYQFFIFLRWIRKLCKCKTGRFKKGTTVQFCNPETIKRMLDYIVESTKLPF